MAATTSCGARHAPTTPATTIVWGTSDGDNIVWGTAGSLDPVWLGSPDGTQTPLSGSDVFDRLRDRLLLRLLQYAPPQLAPPPPPDPTTTTTTTTTTDPVTGATTTSVSTVTV